MKNFVITQILPHGARFAQMSSNFKLNVCIKNDVVSLDFIDEESNQELFTTFFFIDYEGYKSFDDFSGKGLAVSYNTSDAADDLTRADLAAYHNISLKIQHLMSYKKLTMKLIMPLKHYTQ